MPNRFGDAAVDAPQVNRFGDAPSQGATQTSPLDDGFFSSWWNSLKSIPAGIYNDLRIHSAEEKRAAINHALDVADKYLNGSDTDKAAARDTMIGAVPLGSTGLKAARGNYAGAAGDVAGLATAGLLTHGVIEGAPKIGEAVSSAAGAVRDALPDSIPAIPGVAQDVAGVVSPRAAHALSLANRGVKVGNTILDAFRPDPYKRMVRNLNRAAEDAEAAPRETPAAPVNRFGDAATAADAATKIEDAADAQAARMKMDGENIEWANRARKADRFAAYMLRNKLDPTPENLAKATKALAETKPPSPDDVDMIHDRLNYTPKKTEPATDFEKMLQDSIDQAMAKRMKDAIVPKP